MSEDEVFVQDFARWYRTLDLEPNPEGEARRRGAVRALVEAAEWEDIETLVRIALKVKKPPSHDATSRVLKFLRDADDTIPTQGNDREVQILCAAALSELFRQKHERVAAGAALAVSMATTNGTRRKVLPLDLAAGAEAAIVVQAKEMRERPALRETAPAFPKAEFDKLVATYKASPDPNTAGTAFGSLAEASNNAFMVLTRWHSSNLSRIADYFVIQDEELQMLWWILGERSVDRDCAFSKLSQRERPLVMAKELAGMTGYLPGPFAIKSLLSRAGLRGRDKMTIVECVNACDQAWLEACVGDHEPSPVTRPIHAAITRKLETGDDASWVAGWAAAADIDATEKLSTLFLGLLFYRERLLAINE